MRKSEADLELTLDVGQQRGTDVFLRQPKSRKTKFAHRYSTATINTVQPRSQNCRTAHGVVALHSQDLSNFERALLLGPDSPKRSMSS